MRKRKEGDNTEPRENVGQAGLGKKLAGHLVTGVGSFGGNNFRLFKAWHCKDMSTWILVDRSVCCAIE